MNEIFKDIPWYSWKYQISNIWNIKSLHHWKERILKTRHNLNRWWYTLVDLRKWEFEKKTFRVSRLVAEAFLWLDISNIKLLVCHKDDNPLNNSSDNLFIWTQKDNMLDCSTKWRTAFLWVKWKEHPASKRIWLLDGKWNISKIWDSIRDASNELWLNEKRVSEVAKWVIKNTKWFKFIPVISN